MNEKPIVTLVKLYLQLLEEGSITTYDFKQLFARPATMSMNEKPIVILVKLYLQLLEEGSITTYDFKQLLKNLTK
jgi:hypothetical protein